MTYSDEAIVSAILSHRTHKEAIKALGIQERHFYRRLQAAELQSKLRAARENVMQEALQKLQCGTTEAVDVLREVMNSKKTNAQTRVTAANTLLQNSLRMTEQLDIIKRIEALENGN